MARAFGIGIVLALVLIVVVLVLAWTGVLQLRSEPEVPQEVLIMGVGPDSEGVEVVTFAFTLEKGTHEVTLLDTNKPITVSGTSASTAREALPFVGEQGMADVLKGQTNGVKRDWVSIPASAWAELVDGAGGMRVDVPQDMSVYRDGALVVLDSGSQNLDGLQLVALSSSVDLLTEEQSSELLSGLSSGISAIVSEKIDGLSDLVKSGQATSSLSPAQIGAFAEAE